MNPYNILNISEKATEAEIKKAYRKLAAKHHPDKGGDEELFKQINEAYSMIGNPQKRQEYEASQSLEGFGDIFGNFGNIFEEFFGRSSHTRRQQLREQTDQEIIFDLRVSLDQIKKGLVKKATFSRNKKCLKCRGIGGDKKHACNTCRATGTITIRAANIIQQTTCRDCYGSGFTFTNKCNICNGDGVTQIKESISFGVKQKK